MQPQEIDDKMVNDTDARRLIAKTLHGFCITYLYSHFFMEPASYFREVCDALENQDYQRLLIIGFRGCMKSTLTSLALPLWAALEKPELYPFIILLADSMPQSSLVASSIQYELKNNDLILRDYGNLKYKQIDSENPEYTLEGDEDWRAMSFVLDNGVRIIARSRGQKVRGIKHRQHRPSLVIADDVEDLDWLRTVENRNKSDKWMRGNVMPSIEERRGRLIVIGNWLHMDGLMARLKNTGMFKVIEIPMITPGDGPEVDRVTWKAKYPTQKHIDDKRRELGDSGFRREMLLQIVPEEGQDILPEDLHYYDDPPFDDGNYMAHGVDLAIGQKESSDYTAIISAEVAWPNQRLEIFIQPNPVIRRMNFNDTIQTLEQTRKSTVMSSEFFVEAVSYQQVAIEELERRGFAVRAMHPTKDKRARLRVAAPHIKSGLVKFPRTGCEQLIGQLLGFGAEKHDDAVDALVYLIIGLVGDGVSPQEIHYV
jgi:predicted phage terminase large subunit-like protein